MIESPVSTAGVIESVTIEVNDYFTSLGGEINTVYQVSWTGVDGLWANHSLFLDPCMVAPLRISITDRPRGKDVVASVELLVDDEGQVRATITPLGGRAYPIPIKQGWRYLGVVAGDGPAFTRPGWSIGETKEIS